MNRQRDAVGLTAFDDRHRRACCRRARGPGTCARCWSRSIGCSSAQQTNVAKPLHQLADSLTKRGMVVLISDLLDDPERGDPRPEAFQFRGTDVIVFHVLDPRRDRVSVRAGDAVRGSGDQRRGDGGAGAGARALPRADRRADRALPARARRAPASTTTCSRPRSRSSWRCWRICRRAGGRCDHKAGEAV